LRDDFGKIGADLHEVEPLLRKGATAEIDTRAPVAEVADRLEAIAAAAG
jgi:hypothetical protein